jgi:transcriptional regulator with XRE-family HTH domain
VSKLDVGTLGEYIREQRHAAQLSLRQLARNAGVSNPYLSQVERGLRNPSAEILTQIAAALRISAETLYVRAGLLEAQDASRVRTAIVRDSSLTERQRSALLEIYSAFVEENSARAGGDDTAGPAPREPDTGRTVTETEPAPSQTT